MPWKESDTVSERMKFVVRLQQGERMADLCREFGISRKTGYKIVNRYKVEGPDGLFDVSRRPWFSPRRTKPAVADLIVAIRRRYPTWGPKKLKLVLEEEHRGVHIPAASTIGVILDDAGLIDPRKSRRRVWPNPTPLRDSAKPNDIWSMDFKGQFRLGNRQFCYPLTVTDHYSRYLVGCDALTNTNSAPALGSLRMMFKEFGLPEVMRSDNGCPFASTGLAGLSKLSVWLMRLGVRVERIEPGHPEQNGRHERMHRDLKAETTRPPGANLLQQQERFDEFRVRHNEIRPHEALGMKRPVQVYQPSLRPYVEYPTRLTYPLHDHTIRVYERGEAFLPMSGRPRVHIGAAFAYQELGIRQVADGTWLVTFMALDLGYLDLETRHVVPLAEPPEAGATKPAEGADRADKPRPASKGRSEAPPATSPAP